MISKILTQTLRNIADQLDAGNCNLQEEEMLKIMDAEQRMNLRVYNFPTSQIKLSGNNSSYFEVISSLQFEEMNKALLKIYPIINLDKIYKLIDDIDIINDTHKKFYKTMIGNRYEKIINYSYEKLVKR